MYILRNKLNSRIRHFESKQEALAWVSFYEKYYGEGIYFIEYQPEYQPEVKSSAGASFNNDLT